MQLLRPNQHLANRRYYLQNKERLLAKKRKLTPEQKRRKEAYAKKWRQKNKDRALNNDTRRSYGITREVYDAICSAVTHCPICGEELVVAVSAGPVKNAKVLDHCHETGEIRGVVCSRCNLALGGFRHDVKILETAIAWLRRKPLELERVEIKRTGRPRHPKNKPIGKTLFDV